MNQAVSANPVYGSMTRVVHIYTPASGFNGYRNRVRFSNGEATLQEPQVVDFNSAELWLQEHQAFEQLVGQFKKMPGYQVKVKAEIDLDDLESIVPTQEPEPASSFFESPDEPEPEPELEPESESKKAIKEAIAAVSG